MFSRQVLRTARVAAPRRLVAASPVRTFAAAAANDVKPPVQVFGVDGTYATALVRLPPSIITASKKVLLLESPRSLFSDAIGNAAGAQRTTLYRAPCH